MFMSCVCVVVIESGGREFSLPPTIRARISSIKSLMQVPQVSSTTSIAGRNISLGSDLVYCVILAFPLILETPTLKTGINKTTFLSYKQD